MGDGVFGSSTGGVNTAGAAAGASALTTRTTGAARAAGRAASGVRLPANGVARSMVNAMMRCRGVRCGRKKGGARLLIARSQTLQVKACAATSASTPRRAVLLRARAAAGMRWAG